MSVSLYFVLHANSEVAIMVTIVHIVDPSMRNSSEQTCLLAFCPSLFISVVATFIFHSHKEAEE